MVKLYRHSKSWTNEEDDFLSTYVGNKTYNWIATKLRRTPKAVEGRLNTLGIKDKHAETNTFSANEIGKVLGKNHETIRRWIKKYGLKAEQKNTSYKGDNFNRYYINPEDVWIFVREHKHLIDFTKIQKGILLPEPDWLRDEIIKSYDGKVIKKGTPWTEEEKNIAWDMFCSGYRYEDISKEISRLVKGVEKALSRLINRNINNHVKQKQIV